MTYPPAQAPSNSQGAHLVLYDGVCGLCSRLLQFLLSHDHHDGFNFASLQSATGKEIVARWGGNPDELTSFYVLANYRRVTLGCSAGVGPCSSSPASWGGPGRWQ